MTTVVGEQLSTEFDAGESIRTATNARPAAGVCRPILDESIAWSAADRTWLVRHGIEVCELPRPRRLDRSVHAEQRVVRSRSGEASHELAGLGDGRRPDRPSPHQRAPPRRPHTTTTVVRQRRWLSNKVRDEHINQT